MAAAAPEPGPRAGRLAGPVGAERAVAERTVAERTVAERTGAEGTAPDRVPMPLFLHRDTYRRRRVMDAARLLPLFGAALLMVPLLWASGHGTASGAVYVFLAWFGLIGAAAVLSRRLSAPLRAHERTRRDAAAQGEGT